MAYQVEVACVYCGVVFERPDWQVRANAKRGRRNYCTPSHVKFGNPSTNPETRMTLAERAWVKIKRGEGCWEWQGSRNGYGYGVMLSQAGGRKRYYLGHRVIWEEAHGPIPAKMEICHRCDNPRCCRPDHLFAGTHAENMADMVAKGRNRRRDEPTSLPADYEAMA